MTKRKRQPPRGNGFTIAERPQGNNQQHNKQQHNNPKRSNQQHNKGNKKQTKPQSSGDGYGRILFDSTRVKQDMPIIFIVFALLFFGGGWVFIEDYLSSVAGYRSINTAKISEWTYWIVGAFPQLISIAAWRSILAYSSLPVITDKIKITLGSLYVIFGIAFFVDFYWDMEFRTGGLFSWERTVAEPWATLGEALETFLIFTMGSELLLVYAGTYLWLAYPTFFAEIANQREKRRRARPIS